MLQIMYLLDKADRMVLWWQEAVLKQQPMNAGI